MERRRHDLYVLIIQLVGAADEQGVILEIERAIRRAIGGIEVSFSPGVGETEKPSIPVASLTSNFGRFVVGKSKEQIDPDAWSLLTDAADMLALALEARAATNESERVDAISRQHRNRFENISVGIVVHKPSGAIAYANKAACEILEIENECYMPKSSRRPEWYFAHEKGAAFRAEDYPGVEMARDGKLVREVIVGVRPSTLGPMRWFSVGAEPQYEERTGLQKETIVSLVDVTALKQVEEALRLSEDKFSTAFHSSPDAININRLSDGLYLDINKAFMEWTGYTRDELLGKSSLELSIWVNPEDRAALVNGLRERGEYMGLEAQFRKKNGEIGIGLMSARITNVDGEPCIISVTRDITEQRRAEEIRQQLEAQMEAQKRQFYRDTIMSVTSGKLLICDDADVQTYLSSAEVEFDVLSAQDLEVVRKRLGEYYRGKGLSGERLDDFMLAIGECATNAIKHFGSGHVYAGRHNGAVWTGVSDQGKGIESLILPQAVLYQGFSTKPSLGLGYSIMLDASDRLMLKTGESGTTVVLLKNIEEHDRDVDLAAIPDAWDSVPDA